jgi:hypothetical protein
MNYQLFLQFAPNSMGTLTASFCSKRKLWTDSGNVGIFDVHDYGSRLLVRWR